MQKVNSNRINSVERALDVLGCFSIDVPELGISEIAKLLGMYKSTIHRTLKTLEDRGFVIQNLQNQKYRLGFRLFDLGSAVISKLEVRDIALPVMNILSAQTKETVTLNVVENDERVCIEKVESIEAVRSFARVGRRNPLYLGASGKSLLAFLPKADIERILFVENLGLTVLGRLVKQEELSSELELIRKQDFAFSSNERDSGSNSIAAPIRNHQGIVIAGIGISGPESRFREERLKVLTSAVIQAAKDISLRLGFKDTLDRNQLGSPL